MFVYQIGSYRYWERELGRSDFVHGQFGENFTVEGLADDEVYIRDRYRIGEAIFEVTQPRVTCYRVGIRMNDPRIPAMLVSHRRPASTSVGTCRGLGRNSRRPNRPCGTDSARRAQRRTRCLSATETHSMDTSRFQSAVRMVLVASPRMCSSSSAGASSRWPRHVVTVSGRSPPTLISSST